MSMFFQIEPDCDAVMEFDPWLKHEIREAHALVSDAGEAMLEAGIEEEEILRVTQAFTRRINCESFFQWQNRLSSACLRAINKEAK